MSIFQLNHHNLKDTHNISQLTFTNKRKYG